MLPRLRWLSRNSFLRIISCLYWLKSPYFQLWRYLKYSQFFSHNILFAFFINRCGRYYDIDDSKRVVPEIAHVFIGTILRLISFGQPILVFKTVLNDKTYKYMSVLKTTISTEFVEYCWYGWSKKWMKEWWSKFLFGMKKKYDR